MKLSALVIVILLFGFLINYSSENNIKGYSSEPNKVIQPLPLILVKDSSFILQPIVENMDSPGNKFIVTLKLYYKDKMVKPLEFKKGPPLDTYCSDSTYMIFYLQNKNMVKVSSIKRMSCRILAIFNIDQSQNKLLKTYPIDSIKVTNEVTDNSYVIIVKDKQYLNRLITEYSQGR
jgi:hypothetical protein